MKTLFHLYLFKINTICSTHVLIILIAFLLIDVIMQRCKWQILTMYACNGWQRSQAQKNELGINGVV
jgi:hypothetical protein